MVCVKEENVVFLTVTSFVGVGVGAKHYYGKLEHLKGGASFEVTFLLSEKEAAAFNKEWGWLTKTDAGYSKGEPSERFPSEKKVIAAARRQFKGHFPKATVLVLGSPGAVEPQEILVGPKEFKEKINILANRYDELDWDINSDRPEIRRLEKKWQKLWPRKYTNFGG